MIQPQRLPNEEYKDYKFRRTFANFSIKQLMKGKLFYDSNQTTDRGVKIPYQNLEKQKKRAEVYHYSAISKG